MYGTTCAQPAVVLAEREVEHLLAAPTARYAVPVYAQVKWPATTTCSWARRRTPSRTSYAGRRSPPAPTPSWPSSTTAGS